MLLNHTFDTTMLKSVGSVVQEYFETMCLLKTEWYLLKYQANTLLKTSHENCVVNALRYFPSQRE